MGSPSLGEVVIAGLQVEVAAGIVVMCATSVMHGSARGCVGSV